MKKYFTFILLLASICCAFDCEAFENETLKYVIQYKWGMVHKEAGDATLSLRNSGDKYQITLTGKTRPWADKFFSVRDTLKGTIKKDGLKPLSYIKATHEGGYYCKDVIKYSYAGNTVGATTHRYRDKKGNTSESTYSFTGSFPAYDMLSIFYYLRSVDFNKFPKGTSLKVTMFSGKKKETLTFRNDGLETIKLNNNTKREAYKISFTFSEGTKKGSSDAMQVWISADSRHIPLLVVGNLSVGQIRCNYVGG